MNFMFVYDVVVCKQSEKNFKKTMVAEQQFIQRTVYRISMVTAYDITVTGNFTAINLL